MIENLAFQFASQDTSTLTIIALALTIAGALIAAATIKKKFELKRVPYFVNFTIIYLFASLSSILWLFTPTAAANGIFWVLILLVYGSTLVCGYLFGRIAIERSRDAYGSGEYAFLAFIPLANLWLFFKPSKNTYAGNHYSLLPFMRGWIGVLTGLFIFIFASGIFAAVEEEIEVLSTSTEDSIAVQNLSIESLISVRGLETTLQILAEEAETPIIVDEVTKLDAIVANGKQLRRTYIVDIDVDFLTPEFKANIQSTVCTHSPFFSIFRADGSIHEIYEHPDGTIIGSVLVTRDTCGL